MLVTYRYRCRCGCHFDEPLRLRWWEHHAPGIIEPMSMEVCPECGEQDYEEEEDEDEDLRDQ